MDRDLFERRLLALLGVVAALLGILILRWKSPILSVVEAERDVPVVLDVPRPAGG